MHIYFLQMFQIIFVRNVESDDFLPKVREIGDEWLFVIG